MDYEKKYKEALGRAKGIHSFSSDIAEIKRMEQIFPELAESEDERIRKVQLDYWRSVGGKEWHGVPVQETIAWLEKQSGQKPFDYENANIQQNNFAPKFKLGDWIVWKDKYYKVNDNGCGYELFDTNGLSTSLEYGTVDENAHLWTIQDAKEGDVLAFDDGHIILVKESHNSFWRWRLSCWCHLLDGEFEVVEYHTKTEGLHHATKEQRDLLFLKMREAGYEWDAEKKELRKMEQISAWCEEDETVLNNLIYALANDRIGNDRDEYISWLKSLKQRMDE